MLRQVLFYLGLLGLAHAGYSASEYRTYLKVVEQDFEALPLDIAIEALVSLLLSLVGIVSMRCDFQNIQWPEVFGQKTFDEVHATSSFVTFNHRARHIYSADS